MAEWRFGACIGAAALFFASAIWIYVKTGGYDGEANKFAAIYLCGFIGLFAAYRRSAQLGNFGRTRLVLAIICFALVGAALAFALAICLPVFSGPLMAAYGPAFLRFLFVAGALLGALGYLGLHYVGVNVPSLMAGFPAVVLVMTGIVTTASKLALFIGGCFWIVIAIGLWLVGAKAVSYGDFGTYAAYALYVLSFISFIRGLGFIVPTLRPAPQPTNPNPHGDASVASERAAALHERGEGVRSKVHSQQF